MSKVGPSRVIMGKWLNRAKYFGTHKIYKTLSCRKTVIALNRSAVLGARLAGLGPLAGQGGAQRRDGGRSRPACSPTATIAGAEQRGGRPRAGAATGPEAVASAARRA